MSNTIVRLSDLSFDGIKASLKEFLSAQPTLRDYDFEGSNLAALVDLLAVSTQQKAYIANMSIGEMFMDTAQVFETMASHAKELGYLPRSARSSRAIVDLTITPDDAPSTIIVPRGTQFTTTEQGQSFIFSTLDSYVAHAVSAYVVEDVELVEGMVLSEIYTFNDDLDQQFVISNVDVDTSTLSVAVTTNGTTTYYDKATSLLDYDSTSTVFFITPFHDGRYQLTFGDGSIGRKPDEGSVIVATYHVASKTASNGAGAFTLNGTIGNYSNVTVTTIESAVGGSEREGIESIRFYAPKFYQARERAVTTSDYNVLLSSAFPEIRAINVYGGETLDPPQYGAVAICIDLNDADGVSNTRKDKYRTFILERCPNTVRPIFVDPDFLDLEFAVSLTIDKARVSQSTSGIAASVSSAITTFATDNLENFDATLYMSRLTNVIDEVDSAIKGNNTTVTLVKKQTITDSGSYSFQFSFLNEIVPSSFTSSIYMANGASSRLSDNGEGDIHIVTYSGSNASTSARAVGTIDYDTGAVTIDYTQIDAQGSPLEMKATPTNQVISTINNTLFRVNDISVIAN